MLTPTASDVERFMRFVRTMSERGCWLYEGTRTPAGYGYFQFGGRKGRNVPAHRFSALVFKQANIAGHHVMHSCDVRNCVNPAHLSVGTAADNIRDMVAKGRHRLTGVPLRNRLKTHCDHGHPLAGNNLMIRKDGARICKACRARIARNNRRSKLS